jgi:TRAP-type C4-dicarboxylate transport system substrate-binding protein
MEKRRNWLLVALVCICATCILTPLWSAGTTETGVQKTVWKVASGAEEGNPLTEFARRLERAVEEFSAGNIDVQVFPMGTLGGTSDIIEMVHAGSVNIVFSDFAWMGSFVPYAHIFAIHGLWPKEGYAEIIEWIVANGESFKIMQKAFEGRGYHLMNIYTNGWIWWTSTKPINTPQDLRGYVMRTQSSKLMIAGMEALGASPVATEWSEVYGALELGLIDGQVSTVIGHYNSKFYEVSDYLYQPYTQIYMNMPVANLEWWNSLDAKTRTFVSGFMASEIPAMADWVDQMEKKAVENILKEKPKMVIHEFTEAERAPFVELVKPTHQIFVDFVGAGSKELLDAFMRDVENAKRAVK